MSMRLKSRIPLDDPQVKEALENIQHDYKQIARMNTIEDRFMQFLANDVIKFLEFRIDQTQYALWKAGVLLINAEKFKKRYAKEKKREMKMKKGKRK